MKDAYMEKKKRILKQVAALIIKIFDEGEGINPDKEDESEGITYICTNKFKIDFVCEQIC